MNKIINILKKICSIVPLAIDAVKAVGGFISSIGLGKKKDK